jgi:Tol biopolymer transport system component
MGDRAATGHRGLLWMSAWGMTAILAHTGCDGTYRDGTSAGPPGADVHGGASASVPEADAASGSPSAAPASTTESPGCPSVSLTKIRGPRGGRVAWSADGAKLAWDAKNPFGPCYEVYTSNVDGTGVKCATCAIAALPNTKGQPAFHPNGRHLVFQGEKAAHSGTACGYATHPGVGGYSDLWVVDLQSGASYPIVAVANAPGIGTLHPHFSRDGKKVLWSEMYAGSSLTPGYEAARWKLMIADVTFDASGTLLVSNPTQLLPTSTSGEGFIESHGFSPDGSKVIFSANLGYGVSVSSRSDIWTMELATAARTQLTNISYNEHGHFAPSANHAVFMSKRGDDGASGGTEFYRTNADGTQPCQISHFNVPGFSESQSGFTLAADFEWSPDGRCAVALSHNFGLPLVENIWLLDFGSPQ